MTGQYKPHPAAELFPMMSVDELNDLADDIAQHGLREPVRLYPNGEEDLLLDGRNRMIACDIAGVECDYRYYEGDDPVAFVMSLNMSRRHLTVGQKAMIALEVLPLYEAEAARRAGGRPKSTGEKPRADLHAVSDWNRRSGSQAAKAVGVSGRAVAQAKRIAEHAPELVDQVKAGEISLNAAERSLRPAPVIPEVLPPIPDYVHDPAHQAAVLKDLKKRHADLIARDAPDLSPAPVSHAALAGMRSAIYLIKAIDLTGLEPDAREPFFDLCDQAAELINEKRGALQ